ncbi:hypothetical protein MARI_18730 [Marinobacter sp. JH2]|uniref:hypothetical protein n=1 Tax=Marinobacter sp. AL4B TaxID=2871173 RepID=UPI001054158C|nr:MULTISPECIES: hypothetical protein [unclassified Marinobacter]MBZ0334191.1 hypothetical protein [Marinobacter sp. AL4B]QBM17752.1 hypothetical protein MARI_18730 [Marinobacter sp. JH2]
MKFKACLLATMALVASNALATEPDTELGLSGVHFELDKRTNVRKVFDKQAEQAPVDGELSMALYAKTQKRLAESFDQPMPDRIGESSSGD